MCNCENDEMQIAYKVLWIEDCENINRSYHINYCPLCGMKFEEELNQPKK